MATLGNSTHPTFGWDAYQSSANQAAQKYTMPTGGGTITSVTFYGSGDGSSHNIGYGCIWDSSGNLLAQGSGVSTTGGGQSAGGQTWHTDTLTTPLVVTAGTQIYIGWQRSTSTLFDWSWAGDSATVAYHTSGNSPANFGSSASVQNGSIGAYATYTAGSSGSGLKRRRSGAWVTVSWKIRRSGAWVAMTWKIRRSGAWVSL